MSKTLKIIVIIDVVLLFLVLGLFLASRISKPDTTGSSEEATTGEPTSIPTGQFGEQTDQFNINTGENLIEKGYFKGAEGNHLKVTLISGRTEEFILVDKLFLLCLDKDSDAYYQSKERDFQEIDPSYFINRDEIDSRIEPGQEMEIFLYKYSETEIFVKGVALSSCN